MKKLFILILLFYTLTGFAQFSINPKGQIFAGDSTKFRKENPVLGTQKEYWENFALPERGKLNVHGALTLTKPDGYLLAGYEEITTVVAYPCQPRLAFYVNTSGELFAKGGLLQSSDESLKDDISVIVNPLEKINALKGVQYTFKESAAKIRKSTTQSSNIQKRIGLLAQDVEKVLPEAVRLLPDSTKGILYADLVAVLVEGVKQLNAEVNSLKVQLEELKNEKDEGQLPRVGSSTNSQYPDAILYHNTPNPFSRECVIGYRIPQNVNASIGIYDLNGTQLKIYQLKDTNGYIRISASEIPAGIYIYSLVVEGIEVDSKRMVISK